MNRVYPIHEYPKEKYEATQHAFSRLLVSNFGGPAPLLERPEMVVETFAGVGGQTRTLSEVLPGVIHYAWEKDPVCFSELEKVSDETSELFFSSEVHLGKFPYQVLFEPWEWRQSLIVVDGTYTLSYHDDYEKYFHPHAQYIIVCEQSRRKIHLHQKIHGLECGGSNAELYAEYLEKVAQRFNRPLLSVEYTKNSPTYLLLGRTLK